MEDKIKRPPSILIAQTLSVLFALISLIPNFVVITDFFESGHVLIPPATVPILITSGVIAFLFLVAYLGMMLRKSFGRWMAVGIFAILFVWFLVSWLSEAFAQRSSSKLSLIDIVAIPILLVPMLFLIHRLTFGESVIAYFNKQQSSVQDLPSPPPSFTS